MLVAACRELGALQARPRHRPCADRRGAGHQSAAMGDRDAAGLGVLRGRWRARRRDADAVRGRRREAVDLLVPGRGDARVRRSGADGSRAASKPPADLRHGALQPFLPLRRRRCRSAVDFHSSNAPKIFRSVTSNDRGMDPYTTHCPMRARPDRYLGASIAASSRMSKARARPSTGSRRRAPRYGCRTHPARGRARRRSAP